MRGARTVTCAWLALTLALGASGCARERDDSTPEGALALFLEAIERSEQDAEALRDAYALIDAESQRRLRDRARTAAALGAREYEPWEMLVQGRTRLRFVARRGVGLRARPVTREDGTTRDDESIVVVTGEGEGQRAEIPMRLEDDGWRVVLAIPELRTPADRGSDGTRERTSE